MFSFWIEPNHQGLNEHEERSHEADSNSSFDEVPNDDPRDELEPSVDYMVRTTRKADDLCHVVDPQAGQPAKRWEDDFKAHLQPTRTNKDNNELTSDTTRLTTAQDGLQWGSMESDSISITKTTKIQPAIHEQTTYTTKVRR